MSFDSKSVEERQLQKQIRREEKRINRKEGKKGEVQDMKNDTFDIHHMRQARYFLILFLLTIIISTYHQCSKGWWSWV